MASSHDYRIGARVMSRWMLSIVTILTGIVLLSSPLFAEKPDADSSHKTGHAMGMKMKDEMPMRHGMMSDDKHGKYNSKPITPELKKRIAEMYEKMGACVKTDMSLADCQKEVMKDCPVVAELGYCPLMDGIAPMKGAATVH